MQPIELKLRSGTYFVGRFENAVVELHVARRLAPAFTKMGVLVDALEKLFPDGVDGAPSTERVDLKALLADVEPLAKAMADMPDDHVEYVINACLKTASKLDPNAGRPAAVISNGVQMFPIPAADVMQIVFTTIKENLADFSSAPV